MGFRKYPKLLYTVYRILWCRDMLSLLFITFLYEMVLTYFANGRVTCIILGYQVKIAPSRSAFSDLKT